MFVSSSFSGHRRCIAAFVRGEHRMNGSLVDGNAGSVKIFSISAAAATLERSYSGDAE